MIKKTKISLIVGGGLIVLLFFLLSVKTLAIISYENGQYKVRTNKYLDLSFEIKSPKLNFSRDDFQIREEWDIEEVIEGDFDNDGDVDVAIYLWKVGNYGEALPFWEDSNDDSYKQHLFLYEKDGSAIWHSSNLPYHNIKTYLNDINNDNENELIVLEKPYGKGLNTVAVWKWDDWGFENIWRSEVGNFSDLKLK